MRTPAVYFLDVHNREGRSGLESGEGSQQALRGDIFEGCDLSQHTQRHWLCKAL